MRNLFSSKLAPRFLSIVEEIKKKIKNSLFILDGENAYKSNILALSCNINVTQLLQECKNFQKKFCTTKKNYV